MSWWAVLRPWLLAVLVQAGAAYLAWLGASGAWPPSGAPPAATEEDAYRSLVAALLAGGPVGGVLALRGLWRLHAHRGVVVSCLLTVLLHLPVLAVAVTSVWVLLVVWRLY